MLSSFHHQKRFQIYLIDLFFTRFVKFAANFTSLGVHVTKRLMVEKVLIHSYPSNELLIGFGSKSPSKRLCISYVLDFLGML